MNEESNLLTIQQLYAAFGKGDMKTILSLQAKDVEWSVAAPADLIPWAGPVQGYDGLMRFMKIMDESLEVHKSEPREYFAKDDKIVVLAYEEGLAKSSGKPYEIDPVEVWTLRRGKVTRLRVYYDTAYMASVLRRD